MGCGASSTKGSAAAGPKPGAAAEPMNPKAASGRLALAPYVKTANLGRRAVHDSVIVCMDRRCKQPDLNDAESRGTSNTAGSTTQSQQQQQQTQQQQQQQQPPALQKEQSASTAAPATLTQRSASDNSRKAKAAPPPPPSTSPPPDDSVPKESSKAVKESPKTSTAASAAGSRPETPTKPGGSGSCTTAAKSPAAAAAAATAPHVPDTSSRPALQVPKLAEGVHVPCLSPPPPLAPSSTLELTDDTMEQIRQLASGGAAAAAAAASIRQLLCTAAPPIQALLDAGVAAAMVRCLKEGPIPAKLDAAWSLTNIASSSVYSHVEALCNAEVHKALLAALGVPLGRGQSTSGSAGLAPVLAAAAAAAAAKRGSSASGGGGGSRAGSRPASASAGPAASAAAVPPALREQALWALANICGAVHPEYTTQTLAVEVLDAGALRAVIAILEAESNASGCKSESAHGSGSGSSAVLRCAAWCLHNLAKHKREKEMVDVIPIATELLLSRPEADTEVLSCLCWVLAYLGSNEDNKSHLRQALSALPRLVPWIRDASSPLAAPSLLCVGTFCTGYMRSLDYSSQVVEAGGVSAFLSYLRRGTAVRRREMVMEALFALSNVAGANNATVQALLEAGAFTEIISLLRTAADDEELRMESLYVLTNAWDPVVGAEVATVQGMLAAGVLDELHNQLEPSAPPARLDLLLKGLTDGLKRGQMVMTYTASMLLVELGPEGAAAAPPVVNPVVELYEKLGTTDKIKALNGHADMEVATKANGILTVLKFMA